MSDEQVVNPGAVAETPVEDTSVDSNESGEETQDLSPEAAKLEQLENKAKPSKAEQKLISKLRLKVDGREFDEELPFAISNDPKSIEYFTRQLQMAKAAPKALSDRAELQKQITGFIEEFKKNPRKVMEDPNIGIDVKKFAARILEEEIESSKKSPEQLEKEKLQARLQEMEEERKKEKDENQKREFESLQARAYEEYDRDITEAINSSTLPKSSYTVKKIADYMLMGLKEGIDVKAKDVIPLVEEEIRKDLKEMFSVLPEEVIEQLVGKDTLGKLRKKNIAKAKQVVGNAAKGIDVGKQSLKDEKPVQKMTIRKYLGV